MTTPKTRQQHIDALIERCSSGGFLWGHMIDYAIEQGMPVAPDPVDPAVIYKAMGLPQRAVVDTIADLCEGNVSETNNEYSRACREVIANGLGLKDAYIDKDIIVALVRYAYTDPVAEQEHETVMASTPSNCWRWTCSCGERGPLYGHRKGAESDAATHIRTGGAR